MLELPDRDGSVGCPRSVFEEGLKYQNASSENCHL